MWSWRLSAALLFAVACSFSVELADESELPAKVAFEFTMSGADELSGTLMVPVVLSRETAETVSVSYSLLNANTATENVDFMLTTGTLTFAPGETRKEIPVTIKSDTDETELEESFDIALSAPIGAELDEIRAIHSIRIADHILPRVTLGPATQSSEASPSNLVVRLDRPAEAGSTIVIGVAGGAPGTNAADLTIIDGTQVAIPEGALMVNVPIGEKDDLLDEEDAEIAVFTLRGASPNLVLGVLRTQNHSVLDNDLPPVVRFTNATTNVNEQGILGTTVSPAVSLSAPSGRQVRVSYARDGGDSANDSDGTVLGSPGTVTFDPGQTSKNIDVFVANDNVDEDGETILINILNPVNATLGTTVTHTINIADNDTAVVGFQATSTSVDEDSGGGVAVRVRMSIPSEKLVTVPFTVNSNSSVDSDDYEILTGSPLMFTPGTTQIDIDIDIPDTPPGNEGNETLILDIGTVTGANRGTSRHTVVISE